ncbi:hypothetical protein F5148DRAFT_1320563 [Russula earlei]|uniref:Uncharacterized protein n=1 Tax=Russula earlei TaxID=71964 RepID=A0ACC0U244_9AGAM|nr:hypothetical protein F5148DRAFT_1320563 [Russula earlei]
MLRMRPARPSSQRAEQSLPSVRHADTITLSGSVPVTDAFVGLITTMPTSANGLTYHIDLDGVKQGKLAYFPVHGTGKTNDSTGVGVEQKEGAVQYSSGARSQAVRAFVGRHRKQVRAVVEEKSDTYENTSPVPQAPGFVLAAGWGRGRWSKGFTGVGQPGDILATLVKTREGGRRGMCEEYRDTGKNVFDLQDLEDTWRMMRNRRGAKIKI